jgi:adenylate cyclase
MAETIYRFADCELDCGRYELRRGGAALPVEPQVFDLLRLLIERRDRVVTKDELFASIWKGRTVSDATLSSRIKAARQAIGDSGESQALIQTLHRRGFRFVGALTVPGEPAPVQPAARPSRAERPAIAVLPFANMSGDPGQEYFSDGIAEDIITDLSKISGLFVSARNSTFAYKGAAAPLRQVCDDLDVCYVLEGSVRKYGARVRITAQLIDGASGGHLWAERYDRDLTDVFAVQDEITHKIVESLRVTLLPRERAAIAKVPTGNLDAYQFYLRGRQLFHRRTKAEAITAKRMFQQAIDLAPDFARAHAGLADCESELYLFGVADATPEAILAASARALELDADLAEAHASRGLALWTLGRRDEAEDEFKTALRLDPQLLEAVKFYGRACFVQGRHEEAAMLFERAWTASPDDYKFPIHLSQIYRDLGREDDAAATLRLGLEICESALRRRPEDVHAAVFSAVAYARLGDVARARERAGLAESLGFDDDLARYNTACVYALIGAVDQAINALEPALRGRHARLKMRVFNDSDLDSLRGHPRFMALLRELPP